MKNIFGLFTICLVHGFSIEKSHIPGIWKLFVDKYVLPRPSRGIASVRDQSLEIVKEKEQKDEEILLKLNPDGTFRQCSEVYHEGCWISGRWRLNSEQNVATLLLAFDRQYYGPRHDFLLEGTLGRDDTDSSSSSSMTVKGRLFTGKFMYPKRHPSFFDEPLVSSMKNLTGTFSMEQAVATRSILPFSALFDDTTNATRYQTSDFYGRTFYMTVEPMKHRASMRLSKDDELRMNQPFDIRAMAIQFFANNTFQAAGINKILRGRFGILSATKEDSATDYDELWLQVSLFGAGRSAPGSVYSEGIGLTHDDKRTYIGEIVERKDPDAAGGRRLVVSGSVTFGSDLGTDSRPEPVGCFQLFDTSDKKLMLTEDDEQDGRRSIFE
jgi:hypothetical protein